MHAFRLAIHVFAEQAIQKMHWSVYKRESDLIEFCLITYIMQTT